MMVPPVPESSIRMSLEYDGEAVNNGTMPVDDVVLALQGFSSAYGKVASKFLPDSSHEIRVLGFSKASFDVNLIGWITSHEGQEALKALGAFSTAATAVYKIVKKYVELKKHTKGKPYQININGSNNTVLVVNIDGDAKEASRESLNLSQTKLIDADLAKVVKPLKEGSVENTKMTAADEGDEATVITAKDKPSFAVQTTETFQEVDLTGSLVSNNKETRKGYFASADGERVPYHYTGSNPEVFQSKYAFPGKVRISGRGFFNEHQKLTRIDITGAEQLQQRLELNETPRA